jgi:hypothetical protein
MDFTLWIRASTGRLCIELTSSDQQLSPLLVNSFWSERLPQDSSLLRPGGEPMIISLLTLSQYYRICSCYLTLDESLVIYDGATVRLGAIMLSSGPYAPLENLVEVAYMADQALVDSGWTLSRKLLSTAEEQTPLVTTNGWTRSVMSSPTIIFPFSIYPHRFKSERMGFSVHRTIDCRHTVNNWLAQASHIFKRLHIASNYENYGMWNRYNYLYVPQY